MTNVTTALQQAVKETRDQIKFLQEKEKSLLVALQAVSGKADTQSVLKEKQVREYRGLKEIVAECLGVECLPVHKLLAQVRKQPGFKNVSRSAVVNILAYMKSKSLAIKTDDERHIWCLSQQELDRRTAPKGGVA